MSSLRLHKCFHFVLTAMPLGSYHESQFMDEENEVLTYGLVYKGSHGQ